MKRLSPSENQLRAWNKLTQAKYRLQSGLLLVEGIKVVDELLKSKAQVYSILVSKMKLAAHEQLLSRFFQDIPIYELNNYQWKSISQDKESEGIIVIAKRDALTSLSEIINKEENNRLLLLYRISNPNNLGAIMRSALWFGFNGIISSKASVDATNTKVIRTSMGALFHLNILENVDMAEAVKQIKNDYIVIAATPKGGVVPNACGGRKVAILLGSETHGLPEQMCSLAQEHWCINGSDKIDSLSLPQAATILMYECAKL